MILENDKYRVEIDKKNGAITSLYIKEISCELITEKRLAANFRLCVPQEDYLCNYVDGMDHTANILYADKNVVEILFSGMSSELGNLDITLKCSIILEGDCLKFKSQITNNSELKISEFWFPRLGGWTNFNNQRDAALAIPGYLSCDHNMPLFRNFPGAMGLGAEAPEFSSDYPGMVMPWWDIYDEKNDMGLYLGYHDEICRFSTWHTYLYPNISGRSYDSWLSEEEACGEPVGLVFSHVLYPFIEKGETFETGEFIIRLHESDWHKGSMFYRNWFMKHFPFDKSNSWLRKKSAWYTSIIYQPEDRVVTDYKGYDTWCRDAEKYGIDCFELIGWDKGGLERDYPEYCPEEKLGGREGFRSLLRSIDKRGGKCLTFINYNVLDSCSDWYKEELHKYTRQNTYGQTPNWMAWGESTLLARKNINTRRHHLASIVPPLTDILEEYFIKVVEDGSHGFQIDKLVVGSALDFNPLNTEKPDVALCEGLIKAIERLLVKCRQINPGFCIAAEALHDRLIPYVDVFYRNSSKHSISPLRYVFPEWTSCQHVYAPLDFNTVNGAVLTGSVICVEPQAYQGSLDNPLWRRMGEYIKEVERIRSMLRDTIFISKYHDDCGAIVREVNSKQENNEESEAETKRGEVMIPQGDNLPIVSASNKLHYKVHENTETCLRALVVMNSSNTIKRYTCEFTHRKVDSVRLYSPFEQVQTIKMNEILQINPEGLHIIVEKL